MGVDVVQLYPYSIRQPLLTNFYKRWDLGSGTGIFTPRQNKTHSFEKMVKLYFQRKQPDCKIESFYKTSRQKKNDCFSVDRFCSQCNTVFKAMSYFYHFRPGQKVRPSFTEENVKRDSMQESPIDWDEVTYMKKASLFLKCESVTGGVCTRQLIMINKHNREKLSNSRSLTDYQPQKK